MGRQARIRRERYFERRCTVIPSTFIAWLFMLVDAIRCVLGYEPLPTCCHRHRKHEKRRRRRVMDVMVHAIMTSLEYLEER